MSFIKLSDISLEEISKNINLALNRFIPRTNFKPLLMSNISAVFTSDMESCFRDYKISLQIRESVGFPGEILFDIATDIIKYIQSDPSNNQDQIIQSFGIHYGHIIGNSSENHITDLFNDLPTNNRIFRRHYKKTGIVDNDKVVPENKSKIYFYLDNLRGARLLTHIVNFLIALHKTLDPVDRELEKVVQHLIPSRIPYVRDLLVDDTIINIDPIELSREVVSTRSPTGKSLLIVLDKKEDLTNYHDCIASYIRRISGSASAPSGGAGAPSGRAGASAASLPVASASVASASGAIASDSSQIRDLLGLVQSRVNELTLTRVREILSAEYDLVADKSNLSHLRGREVITFSSGNTPGDTQTIIKINSFDPSNMRIQIFKDKPTFHIFVKKMGGGNYYQKYLKYKMKYLKLKNHL